MKPEDLDQLRQDWFRSVAEDAFTERDAKQFPELAMLPPISRLLVVLTVGVGHLLGLDDQDLAIDGVLTETEVEDLIIRG